MSFQGKTYNPLTMIPKKKGFYINQGPIEFETIEDQEEDVSRFAKNLLRNRREHKAI